jgi:hypothetical protein
LPRNDDVPQTVGEALDCGWEWLRVRCVYCRRSARIMLASRRREETLGSVARRARCLCCSDLQPLIDCQLGMATSVREKGIAFDGRFARKIGMG